MECNHKQRLQFIHDFNFRDVFGRGEKTMINNSKTEMIFENEVNDCDSWTHDTYTVTEHSRCPDNVIRINNIIDEICIVLKMAKP